jgi:release factor glutamine methyltransferase
MTLAEALRQAGRLAHIDSAKIDVELLLMEALACPRSYIYTWPERELTQEQATLFETWLNRRAAGEPVAHILQKRGFWTLELEVSPATLIPRPETELLVEVALELTETQAQLRILDLGTGTGAIGLALARELPHSQVLATDLLPEAVALAERNRLKNCVYNLEVRQSDWWQAVQGQFDLVLSNPPYIEEGDPHLHSGDLRFEPRSALVADEAGLADLRQIIQGAPSHLAPGGWLLLEHGWLQAEAVRQLLAEAGFTGVFSRCDYGGHERVSGGQWFGDQRF